MGKLRRSPFKVNMVEKDPNALGLRAKEIIVSAEALYNDRSILISGPRGIGKSSLGIQLQTTLEGDNTLLRRCGIETVFPKTLCIFYACDQGDTLNQLALDILYNVEQKCLLLRQIQPVDLRPAFEINLGVVKAKLEAKTGFVKRSPATIANQLVAGLSTALMTLQRFKVCSGINIMLDELDQLSPEINFGHFMKIIHETLVSAGLERVTFILAGQQGIYSRLVEEDPSSERIVRHIPLSTLDGDASAYVLEYAASQPTPSFEYGGRAKSLILSLSSGYPYVLHLLGDAAFLLMKYERRMTQEDVLNGIESVLKSDKREKYIGRLKELSDDERIVIITLSEYTPGRIPAEIPIAWLAQKLNAHFATEDAFDAVLDSLAQKGHLTILKERTYCRFTEELFRVFVSLTRIEQHELMIRKAREATRRGLKQKKDEDLLSMIRSGQIDLREDLDGEQRQRMLRRVRQIIDRSEYDTDWEAHDLTGLFE